MPTDPNFIELMGGLDLISSGLQKPPGAVIADDNYESAVRGYQRRLGYERFSGQPRPSEAWPVKELLFGSGTATFSTGDKVIGATSGAIGYVHETPTVSSGSYAGGDAAGTLVLRNVVGDFQSGENLQNSGLSTLAVAAGTLTFQSYADFDALTTAKSAAIEQARIAISHPAGSGAIRGVFMLNGVGYCIRDNAAATGGVMFKATESGWSQLAFGDRLDFDAGTTEFAEAEVITGGTSGATATVQRVVLTTGAWDGSGAGYLVLSDRSGTFVDNEAITSTSGAATTNGTAAQITLPAGGKYEVEVHNFYANASGRRAYLANGEGLGLEFDGTVLCPIETGVASNVDKPTHVGVLSNHLFFFFAGGRAAYSGVGVPTSFLAIDGAGETYSLGQDPTNIISETKTSLIACGRTCIAYITGTDTNNFSLRFISEDSGAIEGTLQQTGRPVYVDDLGFRRMTTTERLGDWEIAVLSDKIEPLLRSKKASGVTPVAAISQRATDHYRLYYSDGTGISMYLGRQNPEFMMFTLPITVNVIHRGEDADGSEIILAGTSLGEVHQFEVGTSDDSAEIDHFIRFPYANLGRPHQNKRWTTAYVMIECDHPNTTLSSSATFNYGGVENVSDTDESITVYGQGGFWDEFVWDEFTWDSPLHNDVPIDIQGYGKNCSLAIAGTALTQDTHILQSIRFQTSPRRSDR